MAKRVAFPVVFVIALVVALGLAAKWWTDWRFIASTDDAYVHADVTPISAKVAGHVVALAVTDNQTVEAGQVLLRLEDDDAKARLAGARAQVAAQQAALATLADRLRLQNEVIAQADAAVQAAQADSRLTALTHRRIGALARADFASHSAYDEAVAAKAKADAGLDGAKAAAAGARRQLAVLQSEAGQTQALLDQAKAAARLAEIALDDTVIRAPVAGVVGDRAAQLGQYVTPGTQLLSLVPLPHVWIQANFKETQLDHMAVGQKVTFTVDALGGRRLDGWVQSFSPASGAVFSLLPPENATGNFTKVVQRIPVRIAVDEADPLAASLRPGMSVVVDVDTRSPAKGPRFAALAVGRP